MDRALSPSAGRTGSAWGSDPDDHRHRRRRGLARRRRAAVARPGAGVPGLGLGFGALCPLPMRNSGLAGGTGTKPTGGPSAACRKVFCHVCPGALSPNMEPGQLSAPAVR